MLAIFGKTIGHAEAPTENYTYTADLYRKYKALLFQKAGLYTSDPCAKEDIVQNAVLRLMRRENHLRVLEPTALVTYMALTVRSAALNYLKAEQRHSSLPLPEDERQEQQLMGGSFQPTLEEQLLAGCRDEEVRSALGRLSERDRAVLLGKYFLEQNDRELSEQLGITEGAVRTLLSRARGRAMKELTKEGILYE